MSFEPQIEDCRNPKTREVCPGYKEGNGKDWISRCIPDENPGEVKPPWWCHKNGKTT